MDQEDATWISRWATDLMNEATRRYSEIPSAGSLRHRLWLHVQWTNQLSASPVKPGRLQDKFKKVRVRIRRSKDAVFATVTGLPHLFPSSVHVARRSSVGGVFRHVTP